jgi:hypothetical protein
MNKNNITSIQPDETDLTSSAVLRKILTVLWVKCARLAGAFNSNVPFSGRMEHAGMIQGRRLVQSVNSR